jgi:inositol 1,4,5-triphosphate receptor type 1
MRAMSLQAEESEGEQNEIRNLFAQLDGTNRLVKNLTKQLTELKDQVSLISLLRLNMTIIL